MTQRPRLCRDNSALRDRHCRDIVSAEPRGVEAGEVIKNGSIFGIPGEPKKPSFLGVITHILGG